MKIDALKTPGLSSPGRPAAKPAPVVESGADSSARVSDVRISSTSTTLAAQTSEVNAARVQEIRQAISEGRFEINPSAIADRLISSARELVSLRRHA